MGGGRRFDTGLCPAPFPAFLIIIALLAAAALVSPAHAQHAGDIYIENDNGVLVTGLIAPGPTIQSPEYVFSGQFDINDVTSNPGFDSTPGMFQVGTRIGFNIVDALHVWNGCGIEPAEEETITVNFFTLFVTSGDGFVPGFDLAVQSDGNYHFHYSFFLNSAGEIDPAPGIYFLQIELYSTDPDLADSEPFWIVFNHAHSTATHNQAIEWAKLHLAAGGACLADCSPDNGDGTYGDGQVTVADIIAALTAFGGPGEACDIVPDNCDGTVGDGVVSIGDVLAILTQFGTTCPD